MACVLRGFEPQIFSPHVWCHVHSVTQCLTPASAFRLLPNSQKSRLMWTEGGAIDEVFFLSPLANSVGFPVPHNYLPFLISAGHQVCVACWPADCRHLVLSWEMTHHSNNYKYHLHPTGYWPLARSQMAPPTYKRSKQHHMKSNSYFDLHSPKVLHYCFQKQHDHKLCLHFNGTWTTCRFV